jgi:membrane-associated protein
MWSEGLAIAATNPIPWFGEWLNGGLSWVLDIIQDVDPVLRTVVAGVGILLETSALIGLVVPGDTIVIVASTGVDGLTEYFALVAAVIVGALTGESIGFALGRFFGPKIRASRLGARIGEKNWLRAENYVARRGGIAVFVSRFLPVLHSVIPLTVGMSAMSYRKFMAWTVPATTIWTFAYVSVGTFAAGSFRDRLDQLHYAGYLFVGIIAVFVIAVFVAKKLLERSERKHMAHPTEPLPTEALLPETLPPE